MTRLTLLLAILALGLGLYIWANPPARERAEAAWQDTRTYFVELYARVSPSFQNLFSSGGQQEASSQGKTTASSNESSASATGAFSLAALFESMRDVFLSFASRLQLELS